MHYNSILILEIVGLGKKYSLDFSILIYFHFNEPMLILKATICSFFGHKRAQFPTITKAYVYDAVTS